MATRTPVRRVEEWRSCEAIFNGNLRKFSDYEVSNYGRVRRATNGLNTYIGRILKNSVDHNGYMYCVICDDDHISSHCVISRLVAHAFIGPCPYGYEVNHKKGVKANNKSWNLEYVTHSENIKHAFENDLMDFKGSNHPKAIISEDTARIIKKLLVRKNVLDDFVIARRLGISWRIVRNIRYGYTWKHVTI